MTASLMLACLWLILANVIGMFPSRHNHWPAAWALVAVGIPLLGFVTWQNGPVWGMVVLALGASVLRWPVFHLACWCMQHFRVKGP